MTVVAALIKNGQTWMVGDHLTSWHDFQRADQANGGKIIRFKNALIGFCGRTLFGNALQYWVDNKDKPSYKKYYNNRFATETDVHDFFYQYYDFMKKWYGLGGAGQDDVAKIQYATFLVVTKTKIYEVSSCRDINSFDNFSAIGSGKDLIVSAIHALDPVLKKPDEVLSRAYQTCVSLMSGCGGDMELVNVTASLASNGASSRMKTSRAAASRKAVAKKPAARKPARKKR